MQAMCRFLAHMCAFWVLSGTESHRTGRREFGIEVSRVEWFLDEWERTVEARDIYACLT